MSAQIEMLVDLHNIVIQIQFSYHFKVKTSRFQLGLNFFQNTSHSERKCEKHKL